MDVKLFEVRDRMTTIPVMAVRLDSESERERWLIGRAGYGTTRGIQRGYILLMEIARPDDGCVRAVADGWVGLPGRGRTLPMAHALIQDAWDKLANGAVVDVEYMLGETEAPKETEQQMEEEGHG